MYAVIETGGKQYKVSEGDVIEVEKLGADVGDKIELPVLLTVDGEKIAAGSDVTVKATAEVLGNLSFSNTKPRKTSVTSRVTVSRLPDLR